MGRHEHKVLNYNLSSVFAMSRHRIPEGELANHISHAASGHKKLVSRRASDSRELHWSIWYTKVQVSPTKDSSRL